MFPSSPLAMIQVEGEIRDKGSPVESNPMYAVKEEDEVERQNYYSLLRHDR